MSVMRNLAGKRYPANAIGNLRKTEKQNFDIKRAANKRLASGGRKPANAIGNLRKKSY